MMQQKLAANLIIGQSILSQTFLRTADSCPVEIQDLLPSDTRFKLLAFTEEDPENHGGIGFCSDGVDEWPHLRVL